MSDSSRRNFLKSASIGAAAIGAAVVVPTSVIGSADAAPPSRGPAHAGPFLVWVNNAQAGEISVLVGETEIVHRDAKLARQLAQIAARAQS